MNTIQKRIAIVGAVLLVVMCLFPPWKAVLNLSGVDRGMHREEPAGYAFIGKPPSPDMGGYAGHLAGVEIDIPKMLIPMGVVLIGTIAGVCLWHKKPTP